MNFEFRTDAIARIIRRLPANLQAALKGARQFYDVKTHSGRAGAVFLFDIPRSRVANNVGIERLSSSKTQIESSTFIPESLRVLPSNLSMINFFFSPSIHRSAAFSANSIRIHARGEG